MESGPGCKRSRVPDFVQPPEPRLYSARCEGPARLSPQNAAGNARWVALRCTTFCGSSRRRLRNDTFTGYIVASLHPPAAVAPFAKIRLWRAKSLKLLLY